MKPSDRYWIDECISLLQFMNSGQIWSDGLANIYEMVLISVGEKWALPTMRHIVLNETWRPAPADIRKIAARLASPYPLMDDAYSEMMYLANRLGINARQCKHNPTIYLRGEPQFSHPLIAQTVRGIGGWEAICTGEAQMQEGLAKQFKGAYTRYSEQWVSDVAQVLSLPPEMHPHLFPPPMPKFQEYEIRLANQEDAPKMVEHAEEVTPEFKEKVLRMIGAIGG